MMSYGCGQMTNSGRSSQLPVHEILPELKKSLPQFRRIVIKAPTGAGKSTQVPQMLLDHGLCGDGCIVVLQPRRIAARMLARRVAEERDVRLGEEVGYHVRFEKCCCRDTRIRFETDGVLLRQMMSDPALSGVGAIVFDEFHERHLYGDLMLGLATRLQKSVRPDLNLVVMSATLDSRRIIDFLNPCALLESEGRQFPVDIEYMARAVDPDKCPVWITATEQFERLAAGEQDGDFLIFMPGAYEIRKTVEAIRGIRAGRDFAVMPLHGELPPAEQDAAVTQMDRRKVIVSTNVAETSLTIDGITVVIDGGLARKARFDPYRGINTLLVEKISRASADQRAGRAGRTRSGRCLRLWTAHEHQGRPANELPEVQCVDLSEAILLLKTSGVDDISGFPWVEPPGEKMLSRALGLLTDIGAIDAATQHLTEVGERLALFPVHPRYGRMLLAAGKYGCVSAASLVAALTAERGLLLRNQGAGVRERREKVLGEERESDILRLLRAWTYAREKRFDTEACNEIGVHARTARQVARVYEQFLSIAREQGLDTAERGAPSAAIRKCILAGFPDHLARRISKGTLRYDLAHARRGTLDAESVVRDGDLIVAAEIREIDNSRGDVEVRLSHVSLVEEGWLEELFHGACVRSHAVSYDTVQKRVVAADQESFRGLLLSAKASEPTVDEAALLLAREVVAGRLTLKNWDHDVEQWIVRVARLAEWCPELGIKAMTDANRVSVIQQICLGARSGKEIKDRPVLNAVKSFLSRDQQAMVDRHAPERAMLSNGRHPKITYEAAAQPFISMRIQELFGVTAPIVLAMGRVRVLVHILAPNQRPVQITNDLASFWKTGYPAAKKELQRRYPKHEWR